MHSLRSVVFSAAVVSALVSFEARAVDIPTPGKPVRLNVTTTSIGAWHTNNGNRTLCDDDYAEGLERLNLTASWDEFNAGLRLDGSLYGWRPEVQPPDLSLPPAQRQSCNKVELHNRYLDKLIPEKIWAGWTGEHLGITVGDSYVSFGRGLTLSLRKTDELGLDNTERGVRANFTSDRADATVVAGFTNITNVDEAAGRYEPDPNDLVLGATADVNVLDRARVGGNVAGFFFQHPVSTISLPTADERYQENWVQGGPELDAPRLLPWLGVYLEGIAQRRNPVNGKHSSGYGFYGTATAYAGPLTFLLEGKAYGDLDVVQPRFQSPLDFGSVQYNALPTAERVLQPITHPQRNIYGARLRTDWAVTPELVAYANYGFFRDFEGYLDPESVDLLPGSINDPYVGVDWRWGDWRVDAETGYRWVQVVGTTVEADGHVDVDVMRGLPGNSSVEVHVIDLERRHVLPGSDQAWREGTLQVGFRKRPRFAVSAIVDYTTEAGQPHVWYPAGTAEYDFTESSNFRLFVGSSRGGLRCVSGVCRTFPPFSGVKGTLTLRY